MAKVKVGNCTHNALHSLSKVLDSLWKYDTYLKDARKCKNKECISVWKQLEALKKKEFMLLSALIEKKARMGALKKQL